MALVREVGEEAGLEVTDPGQLAFVAQTPGSIAFTFEVGEWAGEVRPADPDGFVTDAQFFPVQEAIARLEELPSPSMRDPVVAYLRGALKPGAVWTERDRT